MVGIARAFSTSAAASMDVEDSTPRMTPHERRWRTRARVSRWLMTGMPARARKSLASTSLRQLLATAENSRTASPSI